ncbi:MAG: hypothetical protein ACSLE0_22615 [Chitinophagaceae bacterium]
MEIKLEGQWRGYFELGPEYGSAEGERTTFMLFIEKENNGQFHGKSVDFDGIGENYNAADIHGFLQSEFISFIKQYPFLYEVNEKNEAVFYKDQKHPQIHYEGNYDFKLQRFTGDWEIVIDAIESPENCLEQLLRGGWQMQKEEE